eukprot:NODE_113_length_19319_cov_0.247815.p3 type:complete len:625 gc:universal NODE_113_length_19319_cov_0.247815:14390-12516(-)
MSKNIGELIKFVNTISSVQNPLRVKLLLQKMMKRIESSIKSPASKDSNNWLYDAPYLDQFEQLIKLHSINSASKSLVNNFNFVPKLKIKYNALHEWNPPSSDEYVDQYPNPYRYELENLSYPVPTVCTLTPFKPMGSFTYIDTVDGLTLLFNELKASSEIAIDLEHHNERSYLGITCLMQISTRTSDFIIDTIALSNDLQPLNQFFTDPNITKVLHGASSDIIWLQRDLGLYVVNLFDTYVASKLLFKPKHSLSALLLSYCNYKTDKAYQRADWTQRPLNGIMLKYAQSDTHFLLYIYDCLRKELIENGELKQCLVKSTEVCKQSFYIPKYDYETGTPPVGWRNSLNNYIVTCGNSGGNARAISILKMVHYWRDTIARTVNCSPSYFMPQWQLVRIANSSPMNKQSLLRCLAHKESEMLIPYIDELVSVIEHAVSSVDEVQLSSMALDIKAPPAVHIKYEKDEQELKESKATEEINLVSALRDSTLDKFNWGSDIKNIPNEIVDEFASNTCTIEDMKSTENKGIKKASMLDDIIAIDFKLPVKRVNDEPQMKTKIDQNTGIQVVDLKNKKSRKFNKSKKLAENEEINIQSSDPNPMRIRKNNSKTKKRKYVGQSNQAKQKIFKQ